MADTIHLSGTVQLTKSGSRSVLTLWTTNYNEKLQKDLKTAYKLWLSIPLDWTDGTWVEVEGALSVRPSLNEDGTPRTYENAAGHTITAHDLNVNDVRIIQAKINSPAPAGVDLDDARKYATTQNRDLMEQPF